MNRITTFYLVHENNGGSRRETESRLHSPSLWPLQRVLGLKGKFPDTILSDSLQCKLSTSREPPTKFRERLRAPSMPSLSTAEVSDITVPPSLRTREPVRLHSRLSTDDSVECTGPAGVATRRSCMLCILPASKPQ